YLFCGPAKLIPLVCPATIRPLAFTAAAVTFFPSDENQVPSKGASSSIFLLLLASDAISLLMIVVS
ncbi:hypothetical protein A2U01_0062649, partial [Trifolium medium]|nr:hypothetical protein [Trifolium medium]